MPRLTLLRALPVLLIPAALLACKKKADPKDVKGSCDMRPTMCIEFIGDPPNAKQQDICRGGGYTLSSTGCNHAETLGGCSNGHMVTWNYPDKSVKTVEDAKARCKSGDFIPATQ